MTNIIRWRVLVTYRTEDIPHSVTRDLEELDELTALIEDGPHFDTIMGIEIFRINHITSKTLTIEEAAAR